jgi:hypothetical protein
LSNEEKEDKIQTLEASNTLLDDRISKLTLEVQELKATEVETSTAIKTKEDHAKYLEGILSTKDSE